MESNYYIETLSLKYPADISEKPKKVTFPENTPVSAIMQKFYEMALSGKYGHLTLRHWNGWLHGLICEWWLNDKAPFWYYAHPAYKTFADDLGFSPAFC